MPKKNSAKKAGKEFKRILDRGADRVSRIRTELQAGGYNAGSLARDVGEAWVDTLDFWSGLFGASGSSVQPLIVMSGPRPAYNVHGGAEVTRDSVSMDDLLDPTLPLAASDLVQVQGADVVPANRVPIVFEESGWVITARLLSKANNGDPNISVGLYLGVIATPPNVVVGSIQLLVT